MSTSKYNYKMDISNPRYMYHPFITPDLYR